MLPFENPCAAELFPPDLGDAISEGAFEADMIARLPDALHAGDRVLVIGSGLGVLSTLAAKTPGVDKVIAVELDSRLTPFIDAVHRANGVPWVDTLNVVPASGRVGIAPVLLRDDPTRSSMLPDEGVWCDAALVPFVDLGLVLSDEKIDVILCDLPASALKMIAEADLAPARRILARVGGQSLQFWQDGEAGAALKEQGFAARSFGSVVLMERGGR
jgi:hypothetical protein